VLGDGPEEEIALRSDARLVNRLVSQPPPARAGVERPADQVQAYRLEIDAPGVLERLALREALRRPPGRGEVEIAIATAAVNFRDVLLALGVIPAPPATRGWNGPALGSECAGRIVAVGDGVEGFRPGDLVIAAGDGAFASHMTTRAWFVAPWPLGWTAAEAACLPVVFVTAWYALSELGRLSGGERVLVHAAAGGVGMAAIQWAHHVGAEVFATAGTPEKRALVESLGVKYVSDSRSLRFVDDVLRWTNGEGVDVVLNSLSGAFIPRSLELLREFGRFVELGVTDYQANRMLGTRPFLRNLSFSLLDLRGLMSGRPARLQHMIQHVVGLANDGVFTPLPYRAFPISAVGDGFRFMATGQHTGKIVVTLADPQARVLTCAGVIGGADATYVIAGGLGGLGLVLARWLVERGARHLVLIGRRGAEQRAQSEAMGRLAAAGAEVEIARGDIADRAFVARLFDDLQARGRSVRGIVHAAGVLDDALLEQQDGARLARVLAPKVAGAWNLHQQSTRWRLDFFVLYSSAASLVGSPGQSNYAAANAFLDALARHRRTNGLPGLSIAWGAFSEVGMAAAQQNRGGRLEGRGVRSLTPDEGLAAFDRLLRSDVAQIGVVPFDVRQWIEFFPQLVSSSRFAHLLQNAAATTAAPAPFRQSLETAPPDKRLPLLTEFLAGQVGRVLGIDPKRLNHQTPLPAMGLDSLMGLELRNRIEAGLAMKLSAAMLWTYPTIAALAANLSVRLGLVQLESPSSAAAQGGENKEENEELAARDRSAELDVERLSDDEAHRELERELSALDGERRPA